MSSKVSWMPVRLRHLCTQQLIAFLAMFALLFAMTTYAAHRHQPAAGTGDSIHCELCVQFAGTGGPAAPPKLIVRVSLLVIRRAPLMRTDSPVSAGLPRAHRSRAPPLDLA